MLRWLSRCLPGFSTVALLLLLACAFLDFDEFVIAAGTRLSFFEAANGGVGSVAWSRGELTLKLSQKIFIFYYYVAHIDTTCFAARLCLALIWVKSKTKLTLRRRQIPLPETLLQDGSPLLKPSRGVSPPPPYTSTPPSPQLAGLTLSPPSEVTHAIIVPNYSESVDTLASTLRVLASHPRARTQYEIYLAMEQKEECSDSKAATLVLLFERSFAAVRTTFHPPDLAGEIAGKSSNVAFAARQIFRDHQLNPGKLDVIMTVIDCECGHYFRFLSDHSKADTHLLQDYFTEIRRLHHTHPRSGSALYVCPIIFDRNANSTNIMVRVADILWGGAGLSNFLPWSTIMIPTSVYSLPLPLAEEVGGWDGDATAIGEGKMTSLWL